MEQTSGYWFDVAVVMTVFALGNILFGHFEEHKPKWLRVLKVLVVLGATVGLSALGLRWVAYLLIGALGLAAAYIHLWWLPKNGVSGWSGEPKERYYELIGVPEHARPGYRAAKGVDATAPAARRNRGP